MQYNEMAKLGHAKNNNMQGQPSYLPMLNSKHDTDLTLFNCIIWKVVNLRVWNIIALKELLDIK